MAKIEINKEIYINEIKDNLQHRLNTLGGYINRVEKMIRKGRDDKALKTIAQLKGEYKALRKDISKKDKKVFKNTVPGPSTLIGGNTQAGFFGEVLSNDFITGEQLCNELGITQGILQHSDKEV